MYDLCQQARITGSHQQARINRLVSTSSFQQARFNKLVSTESKMLLLVFSSLNQIHGLHGWVTMLGNKIGRSTDNGDFW